MTKIVKLPQFESITTIPLFAWQPILLIATAYIGFMVCSYFYSLGEIHWSLMMAINGFLIYSIFTPLHDATHRSLSSSHKVNDLLGTLAAQLLFPGITARVYRFLHLEHHRHTGDAVDDPDEILASVRGFKMPFALMLLDLIWGYWYFKRRNSRPKQEQLAIGLSFSLSFIWIALWLSSPYAVEFILIWLIPQRVGMFIIAYSFAHIQHPEGYRWSQAPFQTIVKIETNWLIRLMMYGQSWHCLHHLMPSVPFYRYHRAWEAFYPLLKDQGIKSRGYIEGISKEGTNDLIEVTVSQVNAVAIDVKMFELRPADNQPLPSFTPGSHIDVHLSEGMVRQYSICNDNQEADRYLIAVKREEDSRGGSRMMHDKITTGSQIKISKPRNHFHLRETATHYHLLAGGIGMTPILAMAHALYSQGKPFSLHLSATNAERLPFRDMLSTLPFSKNIHVYLNQDDTYEKFDPKAVFKQWRSGDELYMCGPQGFMDWVKSEISQIGWPKDKVIIENFVAKTNTADQLENKPFEVELAKSNKTFTVAANQNILQVVQSLGIDVPCACTQGLCGTCVVAVLSGEPEHRDAMLSDEEQAANNKICLCVSRAKSDRLVLDI